MFRLPRSLNSNDEIEITGKIISNPERLFLSLTTGTSSPDYKNIVCQLEVDFLSDKIKLKCIESDNDDDNDKNSEQKPSELFPDSEFKFLIQVRTNEDQDVVDITIGRSLVGIMELKQNLQNITFLTLSGDKTNVEELMFRYA